MRRGFVVILLLAGAVGGYAAGFSHMRGHFEGVRDERERHWAQICLEAARQAPATPVAPVASPPPAALP